VTLLLLFLLYAIALTVALAVAGYRSPETPVAPAGAARGRPARVLVVGASGGTGRQLVAQALRLAQHLLGGALVRPEIRRAGLSVERFEPGLLSG